MTKEERERNEAEQKKRWLPIEKARQKREAYEIKEISGWMYWGAFLGFLIAAFGGFMIWVSGVDNANHGMWWLVGLGIAPLILLGIASDLDEQWKASISAKVELEKEKEGTAPKTNETSNPNWLLWWQYFTK